jgi:hypothetical protein
LTPTKARTFALTADEVGTLPQPVPNSVVVSLVFDTYTEPVSVQRALAAYVPATPNGQYLFPADEGDIGPDAYFSAGNIHFANEGQGWGADWSVSRVTSKGNFTSIREGGDPDTNEGHLGWGLPMRAIADGVVLRTTTGRINNPAPGKRAFQKMGEFNGEAITDIKVTHLSNTRAASLQRLPSGQVQLSVWDITDLGRQITRLGSSPLVNGEVVTGMAIDALTSRRVAGAIRLSNDSLRLFIWDISTDGMTVERVRNLSVVAGGAEEVSITAMFEDGATSTNRFATGVRTSTGELRVTVWERTDTGIDSLATDTAGVATSICTTALSDTRVALSLRTESGALKVIIWDLEGNGPYTLERRGEETAENVSRVVAAGNAGGKWVTAMRTSPGGQLKLARWSASANGLTLTPELVTTEHAIQNAPLAISPATGSAGMIHVITTTIVAGNIFQINAWGDPQSLPGTYETSAQNTADAVTNVSIDELDGLEYFAGVRTTGGNLQVTSWHWAHGGGNSVIMLHGNCRVLYAHFQDGSIDTSVIYPGATVMAGQVLGRMGNSGSSSGPHTHIDSDRIHPMADIATLIEQEADGSLPTIGPRPMPFTGARSMEISQISPGGEGNAANSFTTMNGHGMYDVRLGIRPRLNTRYVDRTSILPGRTGLKDPVPGPATSGGPKRMVAEMLSVIPSGARLYIRGGSYDETITFSTPMTVRRYDHYSAEGAAVIGK